jgi:pimeloyl-ACP methyl ester carboxylesterase
MSPDQLPTARRGNPHEVRIVSLPERFANCFIEVHGRPIHFVASTVPVRTHPALVLVHDAGRSHRYLTPYAALLAEHFRVLVPDLPGFGQSDKPRRVLPLPELADWVAAWMKAVGLEQAALMGDAVGCQILAHLAVRHPHRVLRAVLQGPTVDPAAGTFWRQAWRRCRNWTGKRWAEQGPTIVRDYWDCGVRRLVRTFRYALQDHTDKLYPRMHCPTLVVRGALDPIVSQCWAEELTRLLPSGRLAVLPEVPHAAHLEAPLDLLRVTKPFFEEERQPAHIPGLRQGA